MRYTMLALLLGVFLLTSCKKPEQTSSIPALYKKTDRKALISDKPDNLITDFAVEVNARLLADNQVSEFRLLLPGKEVIGTREHMERTEQGLVWVGKVKNEPNSNIVFTSVNGIVAGNIRLQDGSLFQLRFAGEQVYMLQQIDVLRFKQEAEPIRPQKPNDPVAFDSPCTNTDPSNSIDVMVAYTTATKTAAGGTDAMLALIYLALYETNQIYVNSGITQRLRLVHTEEVSYTESGLANTELTRLQNSSDGFMDALHTSRDAHSADCVVLITETLDYCGMAYMMSSVSTSFAPNAFAVVMRSCATGYYSFGHELGHIMGANHDCAAASGSGAYPYNHGWTHPSSTPANSWRTVMAYNTTPSSTRVPYFSNPSINYLGTPTGASTGGCLADNHQVLDNTALTVANFRCHTSHTTNVWMKDTWNDTGAEPDPATAGEDMWVSPYIWVRNATDAGRLHQHQHENPIFGQPNWIYVKLHNGGSGPASGNLKIYYANASVSLTWPGSWTQIGAAIPLTIGASSTYIAEQLWSGLPGVGHYCLLARWESTTDPMTVAEGADVNANTRSNNNIVWRNLNIVTPDLSPDVVFRFENIDLRSILRFRFNDQYPNVSFAKAGTVRVEFDEATTKWLTQALPDAKLAKFDGRSFVFTGESSTIDFVVPSSKPISGQATIKFSNKPETVHVPYFVDVVQLRKLEKSEQVIGGVSYEIR